MTYQQCLDYLYRQLPMYHRVGPAALKLNLDNIRAISEKLGHPETRFPSIHIAGTNGKGSCSHMLAAILQSAGYKTGLYTSPHLKDFRERIKINGQPISRQEVVAFVMDNQHWLEDFSPSFFELTVAMAFEHFARCKVDIAVVEVGLGGRLDSTNIIKPLLSIITNIGDDHGSLLGDSPEAIAREKAGIIKAGVPLVVGERHPNTDQVFHDKAVGLGTAIYFAQDHYQVSVVSSNPLVIDVNSKDGREWESLGLQLTGPYQQKNVLPVLKSVALLTGLGFEIANTQVRAGLANTIDLTGIKGRWQVLYENPLVICDTGHNKPAMEYLITELQRICTGQLHMVLGFVNDKDIRGMLELMPVDGVYYFCAARVPRSQEPQLLLEMAAAYGLKGTAISDVNQALESARNAASGDDVIFVGGSTFVVAELNELDEQAQA